MSDGHLASNFAANRVTSAWHLILVWRPGAANARPALKIRQPFQQNAGRFRVKRIASRDRINQAPPLALAAGRAGSWRRARRVLSNPRLFRRFAETGGAQERRLSRD